MCRQQALFGCNGVITLQRHTLPSLLLIGSVRIIIDIVNIIIVNIKPFLLLIELAMVIIVAIMMITDLSMIPSLANQTVLLQYLKGGYRKISLFFHRSR